MNMDFEKLIYVIVGAIIGFFLSLAKDWLMESKKQKERQQIIKQEKLEECHMLFFKYTKYITDIYTKSIINFSQGDLNYEVLEKMANDMRSHNIDNRLDMIINLYLKELLSTWNEYKIIEKEYDMIPLFNLIKNDEKIKYAEQLNLYFGELNKTNKKFYSEIHSLSAF